MHPIVVERLERLVRPFYGNMELHLLVAYETTLVELGGQWIDVHITFLGWYARSKGETNVE